MFCDDHIHGDIIIVRRDRFDLLAGKCHTDLFCLRIRRKIPVIISSTITKPVPGPVEGKQWDNNDLHVFSPGRNFVPDWFRDRKGTDHQVFRVF